jgi:serine/threonine protein kinase
MRVTVPSIPGYAILGELGRGGMGIDYKAQNLKHDRLVAVKMILSGRGAQFLELVRFRIEAEAIASMEHPNIVQLCCRGRNVAFSHDNARFSTRYRRRRYISVGAARPDRSYAFQDAPDRSMITATRA